MNVIITGASGFVGKNLSIFLRNRNFEVTKLSLREDNWKIKFYKNANSIIHLAGKAHDTSDSSLSDDYYKINRDLTKDLYDLFLYSNIKDFFYFSSVKAVADTVDGILHEDVIAKPLTPYGKSKNEAEKYLLQQPLPFGKRLFIIRPCMIHGPGNKGNLNLLYDIVKFGVPWPLGSYENNRSFLSIDNLNYLIEKMLIDPSVKSGVYNFSDDGSLSTNELVKLISDVLAKKPKVWRINKKIIENLAYIGNKLSLPLNSERLKKLTESYLVSNQKIKDEVGIEKLPINIKEGLWKTIESFNLRPK